MEKRGKTLKPIVVFTTLILVIGCSKPINKNLLVDRDGVKYLGESQRPFSGEVFALHDNGKRKLEGSYKKGKAVGKWIFWSKDGREIDIVPEFIFVQGGTFQMGSDREYYDKKYDEPVHTVFVSDFYLSKNEVTFEQYDAFCEASGREKPFNSNWGRSNRPVIHVSWGDAVAFCVWLCQQTGKTVRLPTEAEWEFAAQGGNNSQGFELSGGNEKNDVSWNGHNSGDQTHPVGQKQSNELGLYDMSGNVWEWCNDWYGENYYRHSPENNPTGPSSGKYRILRGGSWSFYDFSLRSAFRSWSPPDLRGGHVGFRCAMEK